MKRDFTETSYRNLLSLVKQVEDDKWCDFTDWIGDRWTDFEAWIGDLDIRDYINNVNKYHKKVIDKNNTTAKDIDKIFENVNAVSRLYNIRFVTLLADLRNFKVACYMLSETVNPANGKFMPQYIGAGLKTAINQYLDTSTNLQTIALDGITMEEWANMGEESKRSILDSCKAIIIENLPDIKVGDKIEMPIGLGVSLYYKVEGKANGTGDVELSYVVEDQKLKLQEFNYDFGSGISAGVDDENNLSVGMSEAGTKFEVTFDGIKTTHEITIGANTYTYLYELNTWEQEVTMEYGVTTDVDAGSITSAMGIKIRGTGWKPLPEYVPITSPYTCQLPDFNIDWETVGTIVIAGGIVAAIVFAPSTGGASLGLLAF